jgi:Beta-galactosidase
MRRAVRLTLLLALAALPAAALATPAEAAKRKVPFGFFGTVLPADMSFPRLVSDAALDQQMALMARSGVESVRANFPWASVERQPGVYDWALTDRLAGTAARHGLELLATVLITPDWAEGRSRPRYPSGTPPRNPGLYAGFVGQLVSRYGPQGSFWAENPSLPRVPIRHWQIWNEQMAPWFWSSQPWQASYTRLLKAAYRVIHRADPGATVVAGSLVAIGGSLIKARGYTQWDGIRDLYRAGAKGHFDVIAVHPFTNNPSSVRLTIDQMLEIIRRVRSPMRRNGDSRKPIIVTELTWPAAVGRVPRQRLLGLETTSRGQVLRLKAAYRRLAGVRRRMRITQAYWYSWATEYDTKSQLSDVSYRFAGLNRVRRGMFSRMPILTAYTSLAARYQGCRKSSDARRCR